VSYTNLSVDALPAPVATLDSAADLALFTGAFGNPGTITLTLRAIGASYATGPGTPSCSSRSARRPA
jgi:hypothetical protein